VEESSPVFDMKKLRGQQSIQLRVEFGVLEVVILEKSLANQVIFEKQGIVSFKYYEGLGITSFAFALMDNNIIVKRVSWFKSSLLLSIKTVDITNINS
jgi:hypothetical protein